MSIIQTRKELEDFANGNLGFYGLDLSRISSVFIAQIKLLYEEGILDTFEILDEVQYLEGIRENSHCKNVSTFKREPLKGLHKKHFPNARYLIKNISNHFGYQYGGNKKFTKLIDSAMSRNTSGYVDQEFTNYIAHYGTVGAISDRTKNGNITGEWIVFQTHNEKNYYLTLGWHEEGDENIFERVKHAYQIDFPILQNALNK